MELIVKRPFCSDSNTPIRLVGEELVVTFWLKWLKIGEEGKLERLTAYHAISGCDVDTRYCGGIRPGEAVVWGGLRYGVLISK